MIIIDGPGGELTHPAPNWTDCCFQPDIMKERAGAATVNELKRYE